MGKLVFQATLGGQVNLVGPNTASTYDINVPAVAGNMVTTGDTGTVTNTMCASSVYTAPGTIGSGTPNTGSFTSLAYSTTLTGGTGVVNLGSGQFYKDSSGNVGIGTSSPGAKLEVYGSSYGKIKINGGTGGELLLTSAGTDVGDIYANSTLVNLSSLTSVPLIFGTNNTERMRIDSSGNVGIGTSSPGNYRLYVEQAGTSVDQGIAVGSSTNDSMLRIFHTGSVAGIAPSYDTTGSYVPLVFYSGGQERARIDTSGNVGIGTTSPTKRLQVESGSTATGGQAWSHSAGTVYARIGIVNPGVSNDTEFGTVSNNDLRLITNNTERARIDSSGNLLVGATSNTSNAERGLFAASNSLQLAVQSTNTNGAQVRFYEGSTLKTMIGGISSTNAFQVQCGGSGGVSLANGGTSWTALSDERKKDIIEPITNGLQKVSSLRAVIGKYKNDEEGTRRSFLIAQDVQAVLPEAVVETTESIGSSETVLALSYTDVIPLLVAAIKEQQAIITQLQADVAALKAA